MPVKECHSNSSHDEAELRLKIQQSLQNQSRQASQEAHVSTEEAQLRTKIHQSLQNQHVQQAYVQGDGSAVVNNTIVMPGQLQMGSYALTGHQMAMANPMGVQSAMAMGMMQQQFQYQAQSQYNGQQTQYSYMQMQAYQAEAMQYQMQLQANNMMIAQQMHAHQNQWQGGPMKQPTHQLQPKNKLSGTSTAELKQKLEDEKLTVGQNQVTANRSMIPGSASKSSQSRQKSKQLLNGLETRASCKEAEPCLHNTNTVHGEMQTRQVEQQKSPPSRDTKEKVTTKELKKKNKWKEMSTAELAKMVKLEKEKIASLKQRAANGIISSDSKISTLHEQGSGKPVATPACEEAELPLVTGECNNSVMLVQNQTSPTKQQEQQRPVSCDTTEEGPTVTQSPTDKFFVDHSRILPELQTLDSDDAESTGFHSVGSASASFNSAMNESIASFEDEEVITDVERGVCSMEVNEWIQSQKSRSDMRSYYEQSLRILYSLVLKMVATVEKNGVIEMMVAVHPKLITTQNLLIAQLDNVETPVFIETESEDCSCLDSLVTKYEALKALGLVAYELFMKGDGPPVSSFLSSASESSCQLQLSIEDIEGTTSCEVDQNKRRKAVNREQGGITAAMCSEGVPYPLCRFVVDLLGGEDGLMFRSDDSFQSFSDVIMDIEQFLEQPDAFIHLSLKDQWKLCFDQKMHGREAEEKMILDAASRVTGTSSLEQVAAPWSKHHKQQIVIVAGKPGAGKSRLVMETLRNLEEQGWMSLTCKFDRVVHSEPLSIIAHAFNEVLEQCLGNSMHYHQIRHHLETSTHTEDILILTKHIPSLINYINAPISPLEAWEVTEDQIHFLFRRLLKAIAAVAPISFFADDLQWSGTASLNLFLALAKVNDPEFYTDGLDTNTQTKVLLIGSYRDNQEDLNDDLIQKLNDMESSSSIELTKVAVGGFDKDTLNHIVSESLCLPQRKTKALSEIILQKTAGVPIHIIEFLGRLTIEKMLCHSFVKGWEWSTEAIEGCSISESVAELFTLRLKNLPSDVLLGLQICSIFGIKIEQRIIDFIKDFDGEDTVDINAGLKAVLELGLIEMSSNSNEFRFSHDLVAQSTLDLIEEEERSHLLQKLASALIRNASAANEFESIIFVTVDLINRITNETVTDAEERVLYATMNEEAGAKALAIADFSSAVKYTESGLSFLDDSHWDSHHRLMLGIHQTNIEALYSCRNSNQGLLKERINAVFQYASSLEEEFKTRDVYIMLLGKTNTQDVIAQCHALLERLGEPIESLNVSPNFAMSELVRVKDSFLEEKHQFLSLPRMTDKSKLNAMKVMSSLVSFYHRLRSHIGALICARMIEISMKYGTCGDTAFGFSAFSAFLVNFLGEIEEGCSWGRLALAVASKSHNNTILASIYPILYGFVLVWKEPLQSTIEQVLKGCGMAYDSGNLQFAIGNAHVYVARIFNCGTNIDVVLSQIELLAQKCHQHDQNPFAKSVLSPTYNMLRMLRGLNEQALVNCAVTIDHPLYFELQLMRDILISFLFRDMEKAQATAAKFKDYSETKPWTFDLVIIGFYAGLTNCYLARETGETKRLHEAEKICDRIQKLIDHSKWNFENKWLLLKAEVHYAKGEISQATEFYDASIISSVKHKFVNEEAVACELAGYFLREQRDEARAKEMFEQAYRAFMKWGADRKALSVKDL